MFIKVIEKRNVKSSANALRVCSALPSVDGLSLARTFGILVAMVMSSSLTIGIEASTGMESEPKRGPLLEPPLFFAIVLISDAA